MGYETVHVSDLASSFHSQQVGDTKLSVCECHLAENPLSITQSANEGGIEAYFPRPVSNMDSPKV